MGIFKGPSPFPRRRSSEEAANHPHQKEKLFLSRKGSLIWKKIIQEESLVHLLQPSSTWSSEDFVFTNQVFFINQFGKMTYDCKEIHRLMGHQKSLHRIRRMFIILIDNRSEWTYQRKISPLNSWEENLDFLSFLCRKKGDIKRDIWNTRRYTLWNKVKKVISLRPDWRYQRKK